MKTGKIRLDLKIVQDGLAADIAEAQGLIMAGKVLVDEQRSDKPGSLVKESSVIRIKDRRRFVSRGGEKLWGAVQDLQLASLFAAATVVDCGASTGGFTDCALQLGASKVYALEMGFNQLAWSLKSDPRVVSREGCDIRLMNQLLDPSISLLLADISFNSLNRMLPTLKGIVPAAGVHFILLVKPQFELSAQKVPGGGVVDDPALRAEALSQVRDALAREGLDFVNAVDSRIAGREGNKEIFVYARFQVL